MSFGRSANGLTGRSSGVRITVLAALAVVVGSLSAGSVPTGAAAAGPDDVDVVLLLPPADPAALAPASADALSAGVDAAPAVKARVLGAGPTRSARSDVSGRARGLGLTVIAADGFTVTVRGPRARVDALFGGVTQQGPGAGQVLAALPPGLTGSVTEALPVQTDQPALRRLGSSLPRAIPGTLQPRDLARAYATGDLPDPMPPLDPGATIATLQFSGWNAQDLELYAEALYPGAGVSVRPGAGRLTEVSVSGANVRAADGSGDVEVALDQEALFATAPQAGQRVYVAPNSNAGEIQALQQILTDAPSKKIVALSISWGACELERSSYAMSTADGLLRQLTAAGVTVFAASGDSGARDCQATSTLAVDFPASSPSVVAVGGTQLAKTSTGFTETGWSGSGGGVSARFPLPSWQQNRGAASRAVPDIALVAAPGSGVHIVSRGQWIGVGGTSLAAPLAAGGFTTTITRRPAARPGDIHQALYTAPSGAFTDITAGNNGYPAGPGYDRVTGLGSPRWSVLGPQVAPCEAATCRTPRHLPGPTPRR